MALVCVLLRYYAVFFYVTVSIFFVILLFFSTTEYLYFGALGNVFTVKNLLPPAFSWGVLGKCSLTAKEKEKLLIQYRQFHIIVWFILNTITLICFVILCNSSDVQFDVFGSEHLWNSLPIVSNIIFINLIIIFTLCCGALSLVLFFMQIEQQTKER